MRRLAQWQPLLVGGVAAGWATEHSDVRLELVADDPKAVEIALAGGGIAYAALPPRDNDATAHLRIDSTRAVVRLAIVTRSSGATARAAAKSPGSPKPPSPSCSRRNQVERRVRRPTPGRRSADSASQEAAATGKVR